MQQNPDFPVMFELLAAAMEGNGEGFVSTSASIDQLWAVVFICADNRESSNPYHLESAAFASFADS
jgi:hypothetical protein